MPFSLLINFSYTELSDIIRLMAGVLRCENMLWSRRMDLEISPFVRRSVFKLGYESKRYTLFRRVPVATMFLGNYSDFSEIQNLSPLM